MPADKQNRRDAEHLTDAELNELVDGTLSPRDSERVRTHLTSCADCEERYNTLKATISLLQSAPSLMPRRSFQLTPELAARPEAAQPSHPGRLDRFSQWIMPGIPALRTATLIVALLLVSVSALDVITHRNSEPNSTSPVLMQSAPEQEAPPMQRSIGNSVESGEDSMALPADEAIDSEAVDSEQLIPAAPAVTAPDQDIQPTAITGEIAPTIESSPVVSASDSDSGPTTSGEPEKSGVTISSWRIVELGLLLLLFWLGVTWLGRTRFANTGDPDDDR